MKPNQIPVDKKIDFVLQKSVTNTLLEKSYKDILLKYDKNDFFNKVFELGVDSDILLLRDLMVEDFAFEKKVSSLPREARDQIIDLLANESVVDVLTPLKQINPSLSLPEPFDRADYQQRALKIKNAMQSIKMYLAEENCDQYLGDINFFIKNTPKSINDYLSEIAKISKKLTKEYEKVIKTGHANNEVLNEAIDFIGRCNRTPIFVNSLKERQNIGDVTAIILKIERSAKITQQILAKKITDPTLEQMRIEIQNYIVNDTHL